MATPRKVPSDGGKGRRRAAGRFLPALGGVTEELDYTEALEWFGLGFRNQKNGAGKPEKTALGVDTRTDNGRLIVSRVPRDSPAFESGLSVDDEIIALDEFRVRPDQLAPRLENYRPGDKVSILVARRDQLTRIPLTLSEEPKRWQLEILPGVLALRSSIWRSGWRRLADAFAEHFPLAFVTRKPRGSGGFPAPSSKRPDFARKSPRTLGNR